MTVHKIFAFHMKPVSHHVQEVWWLCS